MPAPATIDSSTRALEPGSGDTRNAAPKTHQRRRPRAARREGCPPAARRGPCARRTRASAAPRTPRRRRRARRRSAASAISPNAAAAHIIDPGRKERHATQVVERHHVVRREPGHRPPAICGFSSFRTARRVHAGPDVQREAARRLERRRDVQERQRRLADFVVPRGRARRQLTVTMSPSDDLDRSDRRRCLSGQ